jgi:hypothetical protein
MFLTGGFSLDAPSLNTFKLPDKPGQANSKSLIVSRRPSELFTAVL